MATKTEMLGVNRKMRFLSSWFHDWQLRVRLDDGWTRKNLLPGRESQAAYFLRPSAHVLTYRNYTQLRDMIKILPLGRNGSSQQKFSCICKKMILFLCNSLGQVPCSRLQTLPGFCTWSVAPLSPGPWAQHLWKQLGVWSPWALPCLTPGCCIDLPDSPVRAPPSVPLHNWDDVQGN